VFFFIQGFFRNGSFLHVFFFSSRNMNFVTSVIISSKMVFLPKG
jgi:hypothetical protein